MRNTCFYTFSGFRNLNLLMIWLRIQLKNSYCFEHVPFWERFLRAFFYWKNNSMKKKKMIDEVIPIKRKLSSSEAKEKGCCYKYSIEYEDESEPLSKKSKIWIFLTIFCAILGVIIGAILNWKWNESKDTTKRDTILELIGFLGKIFLNLLIQLAIPIVMTSIVIGICSIENLKNTGKIGARSILYYLSNKKLFFFFFFFFFFLVV